MKIHSDLLITVYEKMGSIINIGVALYPDIFLY